MKPDGFYLFASYDITEEQMSFISFESAFRDAKNLAFLKGTGAGR